MTSIISYAQNFEDVMLWRALGHIENGFYIDIGAQDPIVDSVSLAFHEHGWQGVHVEPTPHYAELLRQQRVGDTVIQAAVGNSAAVLKFFEIPDTGISTADPVIAQQHRERGFNVREITVPCITLAAVLESCENSEIHWLKIDVEGFEKQVLLSWGESKARPWIVIVESTLPLTQIETHETWESALIDYDYSPVYFDGLNRYYISNAHPELKRAFNSPPNVFDGFTLNGTASATFHHLIEARNQEKIKATVAQFEHLNLSLESMAKTQNEREQQATQEKAELSKQHNEQTQALQHQHAALEQSLNQQLLAGQQELSQLAQDRAIREQVIGEQLLAIHQQATQEKTELSNQHHAQVQALQEAHSAREQTLNQQINTAQQELKQLEQSRAARERVLSEQTNQARQGLEKLLYTHAQREQAIGEQLLAMQQQATQEKTELSNQHHAQVLALQAQHTSLEQTLNQQISTAQQELRQLEQDRAAREQAIGEQLLAIHQQATQEKAELSKQHNEQTQALQHQHAALEQSLNQQLLAGQQELRLQEQARTTREQVIGEQLLAIQQQAVQEKSELSKHHNEQIQALQEVLATIQKSLTWRATAPLRVLASLLQLNNKRKTVSTQKIAAPSNAIALPILEPQPTNTHQAFIEPNMHNPAHTSTIASTLDELLAYNNQQFIRCAYPILLGREPDPTGLNYYLSRMHKGYPKIQILAQLRLSKEGKAHATKLPGLDQAIKRYQRGQYPMIGWLFRMLNTTEGNHPTQRKLRGIENQIFLLSDENNRRFNQLETTLSSLHNLIAQRVEPEAMPVELQQQTKTSPAYFLPSTSPEPEELKNLSSRARDVYFQLKLAVATHAKEVA